MRPGDLMRSERAGRMLQEWREMNGLSRYAFGQMSGLRQEAIAKCESGKATMGTFIVYLYYISRCDNLRDWHTLRNALFD